MHIHDGKDMPNLHVTVEYSLVHSNYLLMYIHTVENVKSASLLNIPEYIVIIH